MRLSVELWEHQKQMLEFIQGRFIGDEIVPLGFPPSKYAFLIAGCRTGKTLTAIAAAEPFQRSLIITKQPAIASAWKKELSQRTEDVDYVLLDKKVETRDGVVKGVTKSSDKAAFLRDYIPNSKQSITVVNYETAKLILPTLAALKPEYVVLDESHIIKAHNSGISQELAMELKQVPHKLEMTGTSWNDRPTDLFGQVRFFAPYRSGKAVASRHLGTWTKFFDTHVNYWVEDNIKIPKDYKELDKLTTMLNDFTMYVRTEDVIDLPEANHLEYVLPMPAKMEKAYRDLERNMVAKFGDDLFIADNVLVQGLRLHQLTGGYYINEEGQVVEYLDPSENPKLQALLEIVDEAGHEPLIVFTRFKHDVVIIERALRNQGIATKQLTGNKHEHVEWQEGAGQVLIANIQAGGTGVTLNRSNLVVYYSVGHSATDYEQSLWRVRDAAQERPIFYHNLMIGDSIDMAIRGAISTKGVVSEFMLSHMKNRLTGVR